MKIINKTKKTSDVYDLIQTASLVSDDNEKGLTSDEVLTRQKEGLINKTRKHVTKTYAEIIFTNLFSFFNLLLITIGVFMIAAKQYSGLFFLIVLFANISIGLIQDVRARRLVDKLRLITNPQANVLRDGKQKKISVQDLVLSDVVLLGSGDQISIDAVVVEGKINVNESLLTGESLPIEKNIGDKVYSGSYVIGGSAKTRAIAVGKANYAEQLQSQAKQFKRPKSEILKSMNLLFKYIGLVVILFALAYIITFVIRKELSFNNAVKTIAGSLVAMIPSGMYLLTSMTLAVGVIRLAQQRMLVQELYSIETLARVDVLCLDKTGTLTDGDMVVKEIVTLNNKTNLELKNYLSSLLLATKDKNQTAKAILDKVGENGDLAPIKIFPFSSEKKYSAVTFKKHGTIVIGALEFIRPIDIKTINRQISSFTKKGYRVIIVAHSEEEINEELPKNLQTIGFLVLQDHIRDDAIENIAWFKNNGVHVKVISGDNVVTVSEIASQCGIENAHKKSISLEGIPLDDVSNYAFEYDIFGRVSPEQKEVLVKTLRQAGHTVAMTGDGVNDILALKVADCSIAMASGSSAARNVSHLVALDSDFGKLPKVVEEGRRVINNLQRTCSLFLAKTTFAIVISLVFLIASWAGKNEYPFVTNNLYIWEICTIGTAAFFLALQKNNERLTGSFLQNIILKAVPGGIMQFTSVLIIFAIHLLFPQFMSFESATAISVIVFTITSYFILIKISWPLDSYRLILFLAMASLGLGTFMFDYFFRSLELLMISYE
ncbi:MAG: HAD-IC family P-type ATPase, partial [Erysipelotrichia bacterium]|nr:HAD-IC family P-type ATPase [Erysipelotrichia bacterium]